ncbi:hypothetical protein Adt_28205 [Abeliophyllum distichum]|uniref:Uncharacterized protein n=1 Tax=Abeliophyllum distichum TaxID=126358 RepID=A0ABD1RY21_9LAMI
MAQSTVSKARTTRILVTVEERSRTAAGPSRTESPVEGDGFPSIWFQSEVAFLRYRLFSNREILPGLEIGFSFLESVNFAYLGQFHSFGWMNFLGLPRNYCEKVVRHFYARHFYANAKLVEPKAEYLKTFVNGVVFVVDDSLISRLYGIPIEGEFYNGTFNRLEACRVIFKNEAMTQSSRDVSLLDRDMRLLHLIIVRVLKHRVGKLSYLTNEDT